MVQRRENCMAVSPGCMQEVRRSPVAARHSMVRHPAGCMGTGSVMQQDDAVSEFIPTFVHPGPQLLRRLTVPNGLHWLSLRDLGFEKGRGVRSLALWSCLDGFTARCAILTYAVMAILGVHPVNLLPKCLPMCSPSQKRSCAMCSDTASPECRLTCLV